MNIKLLDSAIRRVRDFPRPGILFYDIAGILANPAAFHFCIGKLSELARSSGAEALAAIESRGFVFAAPVADRCGLPLILVRKKGKLPGVTVSRSFALEYGMDNIEVQKLELVQPRRILIIDDLIATGGTMEAAVSVFREYKSEITAVGAVVGLPFLGYEKVLKGLSVHTLINYMAE